MSEITPKLKNGKKIYRSSLARLNNKFIIMSRMRIRTWKAMMIVFFIIGFAAALILAVSQDWFSKILSQEQQITNTAQVVYEDIEGNKYGPVISNEVVTTITPQTCTDGTQYNQCSNTKPQYCQGGVLINNCGQCGCLTTAACQPDGSCIKIEPIKLQVEFEGKTTFTSTLSFYALTPDTDNIIFQDQSTGGADGKLEIETTANTLPVGIYDFKIVTPYYLSKKIKNIAWPSATEIVFGDFLAGNLQDEDDEINSLDWAIMSQNWGAKYLDNNRLDVDMNQDGIVNTIDWSFMNKNWGSKGD